jgi:hypothetical protein
MLFEDMKTSFLDELEKISDISISGLSPETVLNSPKPEPMETSGLDKARQILLKHETIKTAAKKAKPLMEGFKLPTVSGEAPAKKNAWDHTKSVAGHGLAGAGAGKMIGEIGKMSPKAKHVATVAGLGVGVADYAYQKARQVKQLRKTASTPGMALKASQQVGKVTRSRGLGATLGRFTPTIGSRGTSGIFPKTM